MGGGGDGRDIEREGGRQKQANEQNPAVFGRLLAKLKVCLGCFSSSFYHIMVIRTNTINLCTQIAFSKHRIHLDHFYSYFLIHRNVIRWLLWNNQLHSHYKTSSLFSFILISIMSIDFAFRAKSLRSRTTARQNPITNT